MFYDVLKKYVVKNCVIENIFCCVLILKLNLDIFVNLIFVVNINIDVNVNIENF